MSTDRTPKLGEVWTTRDGTPFTCIDATPDDAGHYGWSFPLHGRTIKEYDDATYLTPPKSEPPEWLKTAPWMLVNSARGVVVGWTSAEEAIDSTDRSSFWLGCLNVLTGEWVSA